MAKSNGGIIGPDNIPTGPLAPASGVWRLQDAFKYQSEGLWPQVTGITYPVSYSTNLGDNAYYTRNTWGTATSDKIFTMSVWVKRSGLGYQQIVNSYDGSTGNDNQLKFQSTDAIELTVSTGTEYFLKTNRLFRDVSAWYHIVFAFDSTQGTDSNRYKLYVNGTQETSFSSVSYPPQNTTYQFFRNSNANNIGSQWGGSGGFFNGYMAEFYFIDGQQLDPTSFGEFDEDSGIWKPKAYTGTYGTNGFYLNFATRATDPIDASGNGNNFSSSNVLSTDWKTDTPTNNYATLNPLAAFENDGTTYFNGNYTMSEGNLKAASSGNAGAWGHSFSTFGVSSGKWYWEVEADSISNSTHVGVSQLFTSGYFQNQTSSRNINLINGSSTGGAGSGAYNLSAFSNGDILMIALDMENGEVYFGKNGTWGGSGDPATNTNPCFTGLDTTSEYFAGFDLAYTGSFLWNFGTPPYAANGYTDGNGFGDFSYAVPTGYYALNTQNINVQG